MSLGFQASRDLTQSVGTRVELTAGVVTCPLRLQCLEKTYNTMQHPSSLEPYLLANRTHQPYAMQPGPTIKGHPPSETCPQSRQLPKMHDQ